MDEGGVDGVVGGLQDENSNEATCAWGRVEETYANVADNRLCVSTLVVLLGQDLLHVLDHVGQSLGSEAHHIRVILKGMSIKICLNLSTIQNSR